jgi:hypothetical protein
MARSVFGIPGTAGYPGYRVQQGLLSGYCTKFSRIWTGYQILRLLYPGSSYRRCLCQRTPGTAGSTSRKPYNKVCKHHGIIPGTEFRIQWDFYQRVPDIKYSAGTAGSVSVVEQFLRRATTFYLLKYNPASVPYCMSYKAVHSYHTCVFCAASTTQARIFSLFMHGRRYQM